MGVFSVSIVTSFCLRDSEAHFLVEVYSWDIAHPNFQKDFGCVIQEHGLHHFLHQCVSDASSLVFWKNRKRDQMTLFLKPYYPPLNTAHRITHNLVVLLRNQEGGWKPFVQIRKEETGVVLWQAGSIYVYNSF